MTIGELFIKIGVKGDGSARKALRGTQEGLGQVKAMSLEAKAAIIAVVYGFQQMMSRSMQAGTSLANFSALTGLSTKALQQYQYAARQVRLSNEEIQGTFENLQKAMSRMKIEGADNSLGFIAQSLGMGQQEIDRFINDQEYAIQQLQKFKQLSNIDEGLKNVMLDKMGISSGVQAAFGRDAFNQKILNSAPILSGGEIKGLANMDAQWSRMMSRINNLIDRLVVTFGPEITKQIEIFVKVGLDLVSEIAKLIVALKPADAIKSGVKVLKDPGKAWDNVKNSSFKELAEAALGVIGQKGLIEKMRKDAYKDVQTPGMMMMSDAVKQFRLNQQLQKTTEKDEIMMEEKVNNNTSNFYFDIDSTDPKETAREIKDVVSAYNLIPTRGYGA